MNSSLRRLAGSGLAARRQLTSRAALARSYATPSNQEPDPQLDGYPQLPWVSRQNLAPKGWDDVQMRRNFGDTLHEQEDVALSMWGPDPPPPDITPQLALKRLILALSGFATLGLFIKYGIQPSPPAIRRQYPYDGLVRELGGLEENKARSEDDVVTV